MDVAPNAGSGTADKTSLPHGPNGKTGRAQTFLALTALGVVFGDIGTSPLYLDRKHYYLAHETVVRREKDSAMGPVSFAIFSFLSRISSRAPDYFKIPHDGVIEVGFRVEV